MEELKNINQQLNQILSYQAVHQIEQQILKDEVSIIKNVLIGTGSAEALTVRVAISENELLRLKEERHDRKLPKTAWAGFIITSIIGISGIISKFV